MKIRRDGFVGLCPVLPPLSSLPILLRSLCLLGVDRSTTFTIICFLSHQNEPSTSINFFYDQNGGQGDRLWGLGKSVTFGQAVDTKMVQSFKFFQSDNWKASFSTIGEKHRDNFGATGKHAVEPKLPLSINYLL